MIRNPLQAKISLCIFLLCTYFLKNFIVFHCNVEDAIDLMYHYNFSQPCCINLKDIFNSTDL